MRQNLVLGAYIHSSYTLHFLLGDSISGSSQIVHFLFCLNLPVLSDTYSSTNAETYSTLISLAGQLLDASGRIVSVLLGPSNATQLNV
jgi:hypothetical protein